MVAVIGRRRPHQGRGGVARGAGPVGRGEVAASSVRPVRGGVGGGGGAVRGGVGGGGGGGAVRRRRRRTRRRRVHVQRVVVFQRRPRRCRFLRRFSIKTSTSFITLTYNRNKLGKPDGIPAEIWFSEKKKQRRKTR